MKYLAALALLVLGVWFGGLVTLILFVSSLFASSYDTGRLAAPVLFHVFEPYQLGLAAIALLTLVMWRLAGVTRLKTVAVALTLGATLLAVLQIAVLTPRVNAARGIDAAAFARYHGLSSKNYSVLAVLVLAAWGVTAAAARRETLTAFAAERDADTLGAPVDESRVSPRED